MQACSTIRAVFPAFFNGPTPWPSCPFGHPAADLCLRGGFRTGVLHEMFPLRLGDEGASSGFALACARRVLDEHKWLLWVRQDFSALENGEVHAAGLLELGIDPARVLLVHAPDAMSALRAGAEGLDCKGLGAVIIEAWGKPKVFDLVASRRLTLAAQQSGITVIALHFGMAPHPSAAETRWQIASVPSPENNENWGTPLFDAALVRNRHGNCGRWIMEWDSDNAIFQAYSRALAAASSHRPAQAAVESLRQAG